ncbi:MAG TPA: DUF6687 family protein [Acidimicrobiales bacterium]|nr:DUF6687 family protein [Acidimicrobiales bacterium]
MRRRGRGVAGRQFRFVPIDELQGGPHVVVDGAPRAGTAATLSHWPGTPTDPRLWADVSAEIVLRARHEIDLFVPAGVDAATIDHYDVDAAISLGLLVCEGLADTHGQLLARAAHVGDFDVVTDRDSLLVAFALDALSEATRDTAATEALSLLPDLVADPEGAEQLWGPQVAAYDAGVRLREDGGLAIEEDPALDLAVVRVAEDHPDLARSAWAGSPAHPAVVHSATRCLRVATVLGRHFDVRYRYESWVRLGSARPRPRVDLSMLAARLGGLEEDGGQWHFDGAAAITPVLVRADGRASTLAPERFLGLLRDELRTLDAGPPAWDPYRA